MNRFTGAVRASGAHRPATCTARSPRDLEEVEAHPGRSACKTPCPSVRRAGRSRRATTAANGCGRRCCCWPPGPAAGSRRPITSSAAVVEMIHTATLVHDDVLDGASVRRHVPTVNAGWGNQASILLGDYLFTHAFHLASTLGDAAPAG